MVFLSLLFWALPALAFKVTIVRLKGSVLVYLPAKDLWVPARTWMDLPQEAEIRTLAASSVDLLFEKKALVRVKEKSLVKLGELSSEMKKVFKARPRSQGTLIHLQEGRVYLLVRPDYPEKPFVVETPIGMAGVTGTRFVVHLLESNEMFVGVWKGRVRVWDPERKEALDLRAGQFCLLSRLTPPRPKPLSPKLKERYREVKKLLLPENIYWRLRSPGSRYEGSFTRGFAPEQDLEEKEPDLWELRAPHPFPSTHKGRGSIDSGKTESMMPSSKHSTEGSPTMESSPMMGTSPMMESHPRESSPTMETSPMMENPSMKSSPGSSRPESNPMNNPRPQMENHPLESSPKERFVPAEPPTRMENPAPQPHLPSLVPETPSHPEANPGGKAPRR